MSENVENLRRWCATSGIPCRDGEDGGLLIRLEPNDSGEVRLDLPCPDDVLRLHDRVALRTDGLARERTAEVIEDVVLARSSLIDARPSEDGTAAEVIAVIHADGLSQQTFLEAVFELQKLRIVLQRELTAASAADQTLEALAAMAGRAGAVRASAPG